MSHLQLGEFHPFEAARAKFVYLVPSAAVFALDEAAFAILQLLAGGRKTAAELLDLLSDRFPGSTLTATLAELQRVRAVREVEVEEEKLPKILPPESFPLSTLVLNVTNQCNLACTYCYEYGEDRIVKDDEAKGPRFMTRETAYQSVDFMLAQSGSNKTAHLTFFGGETLLNFPVLKSAIAYAREQAALQGKEVDFSLTTNATLLKPEIIEFLADNEVGVTVSIDGQREVQDEFRIFHNGQGSYDVVEPKIRELLRRHRSRPIGARVTLTSQNLDIKSIFHHLKDEIGFWEVGFAPVTSSPGQDYAIENQGLDDMLGQFQELASEFLEDALADRYHGFSNVKDTLEEIHKGYSKAYPCGAGMGLLGVSTGGDVGLCHRFADSDAHKLGSVTEGVDKNVQKDFFDRHHIAEKTDCRSCWARPLCAGGCYHEAYTRYGETVRPNLHYCEWIRGWTDICLQIYGELSERNPAFLQRFDEGS